MPAQAPLSSPTESAPTDQGLSAVLLAGLMIRPLPRAPLSRLLRLVAGRIQQNHPAILQRLEPLAGTEFLICPADLPHAIRLSLGKGHVDCRIDDEFDAPADVTISGPFLSLLDMMDGKVDGDALFFSRNLTVEGDTEALLTLRNAIDSDDIDIREEILRSFGLLRGPAAALFRAGGHIFSHLSRDMARIGGALTRPLNDRCDALEQENGSLRNRLGLLEKKLVKTQNRLQSLARK